MIRTYFIREVDRISSAKVVIEHTYMYINLQDSDDNDVSCFTLFGNSLKAKNRSMRNKWNQLAWDWSM